MKAIVKLLYNRILKGEMTLEQVPVVYKEEVAKLIEEAKDNG